MMFQLTQQRNQARHGVTLTETVFVCGVVALVCAAAAPILHKTKCNASRARSQSNLIQLNASLDAYASSNKGRQFSIAPDNFGAYENCDAYQKAEGCLPPLLIGEDCDGTQLGWFFGCDGVGSCLNTTLLDPMAFSSGSTSGWARRCNWADFAAYVNGRYFDPVFWAPDDTDAYQEASQYFKVKCGYGGPVEAYSDTPTTYFFSAAALWHPDVLSSDYNGYRSPDSFDESYAAPRVSACSYPELKTRMMEHNAIGKFWEGQPPYNTSFAGSDVPWQFNHVSNTRNLALFYDGSVRILTVDEASQADQRVRIQDADSFLGLWSRNTPLGAGGYYGLQGQVFSSQQSSYHVLTIDGIRGRDTIWSDVK